MIITFRCIPHGSLGVIHRTCHHSDKWNGHIICHLIHIFCAPLHLLQAVDTFVIHYVRICPVKAYRLVCAVEIHHHPVFCGSLGSATVEGCHILVVPVHEVYLESLDTHLGIMSAYLFHIAVEGPVTGPENQPHIALGSIFHKHFEIYLRHHPEKVGSTVD